VTGLASIATAAVLAATVRGYEIKQTLTVRSPDPAKRPQLAAMTVYVAGDRARLEFVNSGEIMIVRLREGEILEIDDLLGCYDRRLFRKLREQWKTVNALRLEQIDGTPLGVPRRAKLVDMLTDGSDKWREIWKLPMGEARAALIRRYNLPDDEPRIEVRRTRERKEIAGRDCQRWESTENGEVADWAYLAVRIRFDARYYEFMELKGWIGPQLATALRRAKLLPLESVMNLRDGGKVEISTQSIAERDLDTSLFEVPEGFKERKSKAGLN
jgi:hypothetical protein